jgi:hypothetical protein
MSASDCQGVEVGQGCPRDTRRKIRRAPERGCVDIPIPDDDFRYVAVRAPSRRLLLASPAWRRGSCGAGGTRRRDDWRSVRRVAILLLPRMRAEEESGPRTAKEF